MAAPRRGRPAAPTSIIPEQVPQKTLPQLKLTISELTVLTSNNLDCIRWLAKHHLIANCLECTICNKQMSFQSRAGREYVDGYAWACRLCRRHRSLRVGSFFSRSHLTLNQLLDIIYLWSTDTRQYHVVQETGVSRRVIIDWQNFIRDICAQYVIDHPIQLGGPNRTVEIDESKFMHPKDHSGIHREGHWVIGMVERESDHCVMIPVQDRSASSVLPLIQQYVLPGTRILTDQWANYKQLLNHDTVDQSLHFIDPNDPTIHTKQVEGSWANAKAKFRNMHGTADDLSHSYLQEHMWRKKHKENQFGNILYWISHYYNISLSSLKNIKTNNTNTNP